MAGETNLTIAIAGAGKMAAMAGELWISEGLEVAGGDVNVIVHDTNPSRLDPTIPVPVNENDPKGMQEDFREFYARHQGRITLLNSLDNIQERPDVLHVAVSSREHTNAFENAVSRLGEPKATLIEKPLDKVTRLLELFEPGGLDVERVYVDENYNTLQGLRHLSEIIAVEGEGGNALEKVFVSFEKDRVPDVLAGRFTDKSLGAYGIEFPHMNAVARNLAGIPADQPIEVTKNEYVLDADGIKHSEGTFTRFVTADGIEVTLAQGLGPFTMDKDGNRTPWQYKKGEAVRIAEVTFADGRAARIQFAPVKDLPNYHSQVEWQDKQGLWRPELSQIHEDNTLRNVVRIVLQHAVTDERPAYTDGLSVTNGVAYTRMLEDLRLGADVTCG